MPTQEATEIFNVMKNMFLQQVPGIITIITDRPKGIVHQDQITAV
jgi:hypothetical protein